MKNAKKQAMQIRYCLQQAKEYFDAAASVSLATKPNLLYYSIMSLALAEILIKQDGLSSLDKAREDHKHHGLELRIPRQSKPIDDLATSASSLIAAPLIRGNNQRMGTFELWHRSCRETPLGGEVRTFNATGDGASSGFRCVSHGDDVRLPQVPVNGISLLDCISMLPGMYFSLPNFGITPRVVRGRVKASISPQPREHIRYELTIHPGFNDQITLFFENIKVEPNAVDRIQFVEFASGGIARWSNDPIEGHVRMLIPSATVWTDQEIRFWTHSMPLNEFGYLYVSLYIAGNYARYYPDKWLADIEQNSPLALAVEEVLGIAERRMALLTLSELSRVYYIASE